MSWLIMWGWDVWEASAGRMSCRSMRTAAGVQLSKHGRLSMGTFGEVGMAELLVPMKTATYNAFNMLDGKVCQALAVNPTRSARLIGWHTQNGKRKLLLCTLANSELPSKHKQSARSDWQVVET
eukprot:5379258-Amphidinium_carterae.2